MSKRKGLSFDEKREKMLEIFQESMSFFTLKELEKIAPKSKGIISQSVKEVLQSLVDDNMVSSDKCGVQTVFWSLPSDAVQKKRARLQQLQSSIADKENHIISLKEQKDELRSTRVESAERDNLLREISILEIEEKEIKKKLERFAECDPEHLENIRNATVAAFEATNRWTDNLFALKSWIEEKFSISGREFFQQFEIPEDIDYLES